MFIVSLLEFECQSRLWGKKNVLEHAQKLIEETGSVHQCYIKIREINITIIDDLKKHKSEP